MISYKNPVNKIEFSEVFKQFVEKLNIATDVDAYMEILNAFKFQNMK